MSQDFFSASIGERVYFINPAGRENSCIVTTKGAYELFKLQEFGYKFLPKLTVHNNLEPCESCSA